MASDATELSPEIAKWVATFVGLPYEVIAASLGAPADASNGHASDAHASDGPGNGAIASAPPGGGASDAPGGGGPAPAPGPNKAHQGGKAKNSQSPFNSDGVLVLNNATVKENTFNPDDPFGETPSAPTVSFRMPLPMPKNRPSANEIISKLQAIPEFIGSHAAHYLQMISSACEQFQQYAEKEIDEFAKQEKRAMEVSGLSLKLLKIVATVALGSLGDEALEGAVKLLADGVKDAIKETVNEQVAQKEEKADDLEGKVAALKHVVQGVTNDAKHKAEKIEDKVVKAAKDATNPLIHTVREGKKLNKSDEAFILPYFTADSDDLSGLYEDLGLPGKQEINAAKLNIYAYLVLEFQKGLQAAKAERTVKALEGEKIDGDEGMHNVNVDNQIEITEREAGDKAKKEALRAYKEYKKSEER